jgi:anti-sigma B factor antagonist
MTTAMVRRAFTVTASRTAKALTVVVAGELDGASAPRLRETLATFFEDGVSDVLLDCRGLEFIDSKGVGELLAWKQALEERDGVLVLFGPSGAVRTTLEVTGLLHVFDVVQP